MSERLSSRFKGRSSRGHVRPRRSPSFPGWLVALIALLGALAAGALIRSVILRIQNDKAAASAQSNRTWLGEEWTLNETNRAQMATMATRLKDHKIKVVYVVTGAWRADNQYRAYEFAQHFRTEMQVVAPDIQVLIWMWYDPQRHTNETSETSLISYTREAIEQWGYDGIHLQGFNIPDGSASFVQLLRALEVITGAEHTLSITAPPDHVPADPAIPRGLGNQTFSWEPGYKQQLALIVDEIVIMPHAGGLETTADYEVWVAYQVETYARDVKLMNVDTDLIVGLPAYPADVLHDPAVETATAAIIGAQQGIKSAGDAGKLVIGAGLYFYSAASEEDWIQFKARWVR
jgi:hypothetical protein